MEAKTQFLPGFCHGRRMYKFSAWEFEPNLSSVFTHSMYNDVRV